MTGTFITVSIERPGQGAPSRGGVMNVKPLADRILVRRIEEQETRRGGIIIPDTAKEKPQEAEIVAVGPGRMNEEGKRIAMEVKKGDRVLIGKYSGTDVKIDGVEYVILREEDVLGVLAESSSAAKK
jgi:chaperonin GroES